MGIMIQPEKCPCCRDMLWHCERCWNMYHHGLRDRDYTPPRYYGQPMLSNEVLAKTGFRSKINPDRNRRYKEGDYGH